MKSEMVSMELPTAYGTFRLWVWSGERGQEPVALSTLPLDPTKELMLRIHSECLTGDTFASLTCDCGQQKDLALKRLQEHGNGIFIYHRQEGRNMGLFDKVRAYNLMQHGMDTHEASMALVAQPDAREYSEVLAIMDQLLGGHKPPLRLLTNNPYKQLFLERHGYSITVESLLPPNNIHNAEYSATKTKKFLHASIGYGPYVGVELTHKDIIASAEAVNGLLQEFYLTQPSRKLFIGLDMQYEQLHDPEFTASVLRFHNGIRTVPNAHIVFHIAYPSKRSDQRALKRFLSSLDAPYGLQIRLASDHGEKIDVDLIDSFRAEYVVFQLRSDQWDLLEQPNFIDYFSSPNRFVLLDESWGNGLQSSPEKLRERILNLLGKGLSRVGVAGGFHAGNAQTVFDLEDYFKLPISVDAYSQLRTGGVIDISKMRAFLRFFYRRPKTEKA